MIYLIGCFGSAFFFSYLIVYVGLRRFYFKKRISLIGRDREMICFLMIGIVLSILILAGEPGVGFKGLLHRR